MESAHGPISIRRRLITTLVLIAAIVVLSQAGFRKLASFRKASVRSEGAVPPPLVRAETARRADYTETVRGFGRAEPLQSAQVAAEVAGQVLEVSPLLEPGTAIQGSEMPVLVRLDDRDAKDRLERAKAEVEGARAEIVRLGTTRGSLRESLAVAEEELETAQREMERIAPLVPKTLTRSDLDAQRLQVTIRLRQKLQLEAQIKENAEAAKVAEQRVLALERAVALAAREVERATVRAPFAGRVVAREVNVGERVRVGDPLFALVSLARVQVPVALPAGVYEEILPGAKARVHLPGRQEDLWEGAVDRVAPRINPQERTFFAYLVVAGEDHRNPVPPGAHVVARIEGKRHADVIAVPRRAFLGERIFVASPREDGTSFVVSERTPHVVRTLAGVALVTTGLEDGERFLVTNLESVAEGSTVRLTAERPAAGGGSDAPDQAGTPGSDGK